MCPSNIIKTGGWLSIFKPLLRWSLRSPRRKKQHSWKACPSNYQPNTNIGLTILFLETQEFQLCRDFLRFKSPLKPAGRVRKAAQRQETRGTRAMESYKVKCGEGFSCSNRWAQIVHLQHEWDANMTILSVTRKTRSKITFTTLK